MINKHYSEFAIASLAVGFISFIQLLAIEKAILAIILGLIALKRLAKHPHGASRYIAIAGVVLGVIYLLILSIFVASNPDIFLKIRGSLAQ